MITEDYVSFEIAKLLKEKGFDENCAALYDLRNGEFQEKQTGYVFNNSQWENFITAVTLQMAIKWLREVHKIHISIGYAFNADANIADDYVSYCFAVENAKTFFHHSQDEWYNTYEAASEAAIKYCLENLI